LGEEVAALQQSGLSLKDALYRLVKTAGAGRSIRGGAAAALLDGGLLDSVDILLNDFFNATEQNLIWEAAESLRQARAKRAVPRLIAALYDPDPERRYVAAHVLGWMEDKRVVIPLLRSLEDPAQLELVRGECAESLSYLRSKQAVPALIRSLKDTAALGFYFFGGLIMMCAPAVPGYINHGATPGVVERPVDSGVA